MKRIIAIAILCFAVFVTSKSIDNTQVNASTALKITWFNVGAGDSILIQTPNNKNVLIDGGLPGAGVTQKLKNKGIKKLDYIISTHSHEDHAGGLYKVISSKKFTIGKFYYNGRTSYDPKSKYADKYVKKESKKLLNLNILKGKKINAANLSNRVFYNSNGIKMQFVNNKKASGGINEKSLATLITYNNKKILLTADCANGTQNTFTYKGKVDILDMPHHGAKNTASSKFVKTYNPQYVVISADGVKWNHPSTKTVKTYSGKNIYCTFMPAKGDVTFTINGKITVSKSKPTFAQLLKKIKKNK